MRFGHLIRCCVAVYVHGRSDVGVPHEFLLNAHGRAHTDCCYATQDKTWVKDPDGNEWEAFVVLKDNLPSGRVIGVDMTDDMLALARQNAERLGASNVEFRKGFIEKLPVESGTVDYVISNCVINLSADKPAVFREIARVLKPSGRFAVSDIVLLKALPAAIAQDIISYVGCISGASLLTEYLSTAFAAGLRDLSIPQIAYGPDLAKVLAPEGFPVTSKTSCCGSTEVPNTPKSSCCGTTASIQTATLSADLVNEATQAVASIKLHGRK